MFYLDVFAAAFCFASSLACVIIHILSSRHIGGLDLPGYVRTGFFLVALTMLWRAIDFAFLSNDLARISDVGHVNVWGVITAGSVAYAFASFAWCTFSRRATAKTAETLAEARARAGWSRHLHF